MIRVVKGHEKSTADVVRFSLRKINREKCSWLKENSPITPTTDDNHDFYLYDGEKLIGGLLGNVQYGWWHGDCLWIDENYRGQGYGSKLMIQAEIFAEENGLTGIYFETWDFQARPFYEKQGYTVFGELSDCPFGSTFYFMMKKLGTPHQRRLRALALKNGLDDFC